MAKINKEIINAKQITIDTGEEVIIYPSDKIVKVFKTKPDKNGRIHMSTTNKIVVIELKA
jgi:hypothetical protein